MAEEGNDRHRGSLPMTRMVGDEEIMLQVRNGAGEMLGVLFDRYQMPLFNFYTRLTADRAVSEDLVQEVFLRILKYRHTYTPGNSFRTWMYQIARNARADDLRKQRPQTSLTPDLHGSFTPRDAAEAQQDTWLLGRALMQLREDQREILVLSRLQELKYEEIAQLLGCEVGAVKVRVHRALKELREVFQSLRSGGSAGTAGQSGAGNLPPRGAGYGL